jgi:carbon-monoxide dehydrogenase large subunit
MTTAGTIIGQPVKRTEDLRLLTGRGRFVDDLRLPGLRRLSFVRSPHARARIVRIDAGAARAMPGVSVFAAADLPEIAAYVLPTFIEPASNPYAVFNQPPPQHVLARDEVRHVGEAVVAIVADDPYRAADAEDAVRVEYEPLPAVVDPEAAALDGATAVHPGRSNVVARIQMSVGDVDRAFAQADVVLEERLQYPRLTSMPLEPRAVAARFDEASGTLTVWAGHQMPYALRDTVAAALGLPAESVRVIVPDTGGGFGPKIAVYPEDVLAAALAMRLGAPVKWIQTRSEFMVSTQHARDQIHYVKLAARRDGTLLGLQIRIIKDVGAYHCWAMIEPTNCINHLPSHYRLPAIRGEAISVVTNKVASSPYRGAGRPEAVFVTERMLDLLATRLSMDPAELRRRNLIPAGEMPYRSGLTYRDGVAIVYDGGDYPLELSRALELADYAGWRRRQAEGRATGRRVGIGIAAYLEAGGIGWPCEGATVKVDDRGHVEVMIGVSGSGQGHETVFAQVAAEYLGARFEDVRVRGGDTALIAYGFGTGASRVAVNTGNAVADAAEGVHRKACRVAARLLECDEQDVRVEGGAAFVVGAPMRAIGLGALARAALRDPALAALGGPGLCDTRYYYPPTVTWSSGVTVAIVEVDPETGVIAVLRYVTVHDCGRQLNPMIVDGQVMGGFAQGLGVALGEAIEYDPQGQLLTGSLMDYPIPRAGDIPEVVTEHLHFPTDHNRLGIRGVGEGPTGPPAAAIANALSDAFGGGLAIRFPVLTPARVHALLREAGVMPVRAGGGGVRHAALAGEAWGQEGGRG